MRIGFFLQTPSHARAFHPLAMMLQPKHRCLATNEFASIIDFRPHVVIIGAPIAHKLRADLPQTLFVQVQTELDYPGRGFQGAKEADFLALASPTVLQWHQAVNIQPRSQAWAVGFPALDPLFANERVQLPFALPNISKTVLYAPTYHEKLSSAPLLAEQTLELLLGQRTDLSLVILPHPRIASEHPEWIVRWQSQAKSRPNVHLVNPLAIDTLSLLRSAGVLVTDSTEHQLTYLACDMPMVLINHPKHKDANVDSSLLWAWRDMGTQVNRLADLPAAVEHALLHPLENAAKRNEYRGRLFGEFTDGRSALRLVEKIDRLSEELPEQEDAPLSTSWPILKSRALLRGMKKITQRKAASF